MTPPEPTPIELLAPASSLSGGLAAIASGADAVYVGAPKFGARSNAGVSIEDITSLCQTAHHHGVRVYAALNTILTDTQIPEAVDLVYQLHNAGADALIIQDLGLATQDLPPIPLHASTQCHNNSLGQLRLLEDLGFEQVVLPREWSTHDIAQVSRKTHLTLEAFVHGALCVSFSGRCYMSEVCSGRSANRGLCAQYCRMTYDLTDANGQMLREKQHLLSLRDLNRTPILEEMIASGIRSFKIEGRLKSDSYVRNITSHYRLLLDKIIAKNEGRLQRSSWGKTSVAFTPQPEASFSRLFTTYNTPLHDPIPIHSITPYSNKSMGEEIGTIKSANGKIIEAKLKQGIRLSCGDGIMALSPQGSSSGAHINRISPSRAPGQFQLKLSRPINIAPGSTLFRNFHHELERTLLRPEASVRTIPISLQCRVAATGVTLLLSIIENPSVSVTVQHSVSLEPAQKDQQEHLLRTLSKMGGSPYAVVKAQLHTNGLYLPPSVAAALRREAVDRLQSASDQWMRTQRNKKGEKLSCTRESTLHAMPAPHKRAAYGLPETLDFTYNVANRSAQQLYRRLGVKGAIAPAIEIEDHPAEEIPVMFTRHCLLHQVGYCTREGRKPPFSLPLYLVRGNERFRIETDCKQCLMILRKLPSFT